MFSQLPEELNFQVMEKLTLPKLISITSVNKLALNTALDIILRTSFSTIIEFIIFNPQVGFSLIDWLHKKDIFSLLLERHPIDDPWRILLATLTTDNVQSLNKEKVRQALYNVSGNNQLSDSFKSALKLSLDTMLQAASQPFFFTEMPKKNQLSIYLNLPNAIFSFLGGKDFNFRYAYLNRARFYSSILEISDFNFANLTKIHCFESRISASTFVSALMMGAKFPSAKLIGNDFIGGDFANASFKHATVISCNFTESELIDVDFSHAKIRDCDFTLANLVRTRLFGATLHGLKFVQATLHEVDFSVCMQKGRVCGLNFYAAEITKCDFSKQDLRDACFMLSDLTNVNFSSANLCGVDFFGANMLKVNFNDIILTGFKCKEGKFSILENKFLDAQKHSPDMLNLAVILVLEFYAAKLQRNGQSSAANVLKSLSKNIHDNLFESLVILMEECRHPIALALGMRRDDANVWRNDYSFSFFSSDNLNKEVICLVDAIYQNSLKVNLLASY